MYLNIPEFIWNRIFDVLQVVLAGALVASFASYYLARKDEVTRIKGILLEKRLVAYESVIELLSKLYGHTYVDDKDYDYTAQTLYKLELDQNDKSLEYSNIFKNKVSFDEYLKDIDKTLKTNRIYLDEKVLEYLKLVQMYFMNINTILSGVRKLKLKEDYKLSDVKLIDKEEKILKLLGVALDVDILFFYGRTEEVITKRIKNLNLEESSGNLGRCIEKFIEKPWGIFLENLSMKLKKSKYLANRRLDSFIYSLTFHKDYRNRILFKKRNSITNLFSSIMFEEHLDNRLIIELEESEVYELLQKVMKEDNSI